MKASSNRSAVTKVQVAVMIAIIIVAAIAVAVYYVKPLAPTSSQGDGEGDGEEERPDPHVRSGTPFIVYEYYKGALLGYWVYVKVTNRGGAGVIQIRWEATSWPRDKVKITTRLVYFNASEEKKISNFIPLPTGEKEMDIDVTAYSPTQVTIDSLIQDLNHQDLEVRKNATIVLVNFRIKQAIEPLIKILEDDESDVMRKEAATALGKIGDERAIEPLIQALKDENSSIREAAAWALGAIGDAKAVEPLINALEDEVRDVRIAAIGALGKIGDERAIEPLKEALRDKSWFVRNAAEEALEMIEGA